MNNKRSLFFQMRLSKSEKQQALQKAQALGLSLSDFYRKKAAEESSQIQLYLELGRLGNQFTQIVSDLSRPESESGNLTSQLQQQMLLLLSLLKQIRAEIERR